MSEQVEALREAINGKKYVWQPEDFPPLTYVANKHFTTVLQFMEQQHEAIDEVLNDVSWSALGHDLKEKLRTLITTYEEATK